MGEIFFLMINRYIYIRAFGLLLTVGSSVDLPEAVERTLSALFDALSALV